MPGFQTVTVADIPIFNGSAEEAVAACLSLASLGGRVATANLDFFALARRNEELRRHLRESSLVVADGMPVVWLARLSGAKRIRRMAGVDLVAALFRAERAIPLRVAIYGSTAEICDLAAPVLHDLGSGARVVHRAHPPFRLLTEAEREADQQALRAADPDVVLVALGCPAQERLIAEWYSIAPGALWIGVGGTFDFFAGVRRRAPGFTQAIGFEWVVRMAQEPRRLGRRYLLRDLPALIALVPGCVATRIGNSR